MAHAVETMAYRGALPWHGLGNPLSADEQDPHVVRAAAGILWDVQKKPLFFEFNGKYISTGQSALFRNTDGRHFDNVSDRWEPLTNYEIAEFFVDFVKAGNLEMHTAGSLNDGAIVWMLAKVKRSFALFKDDQTDLYVLIVSHHTYGKASVVMCTPIRVVCANTLALALGRTGDLKLSVSHRKKFDPEQAQLALGLSMKAFDDYEEKAKFLATKPVGPDWTKVETYFKEVFPFEGKDGKSANTLSKAAETCLKLIDTQPGAEYGRGTWWPVFNTVTYYADHLYGRNVDTKLSSAWFGENRRKKEAALNLALELAH